MKILIHSNAPFTGTAYGQQTGLFAPRIAKLGHDVAISCMTGVQGRPTSWEGIPLLPMGMAMYSSDILGRHAKHFFGRDRGLILVHYDPWAIDPGAVAGFATAAWAPIHSKPASQGNIEFFHATGALPIAVANYGVEQFKAAGLQPAYVPHGVDTSVFAPMTPDERADARTVLGVPPGAYMITLIAANKGHDPPRKGWGEQFTAFARFHRKHPEALLFVHSAVADAAGIDLRPLIADLGIGGAVMFSDDYALAAGMYTDQFIAALCGMSDLLTSATWGEGFGIPIIEAQACGTPVVVSDSSAMPELLGSGWKVPVQPYWHPLEATWWHVPVIDEIERAYEKAWAQSRNTKALARARTAARQFALGYDVDRVTDRYWRPVLDMLEQYAGAVPVRVPAAGDVPLPYAEADGLRWLHRGSHTDDWITVAHEDALAPVMDSLMPEGGVLLDVGAHVGRWALRLAAKADRVLCVEANPETAATLRYHIAVNEITNAEVFEVAAWDAVTRLSMSDPNGKVAGGSTMFRDQGGDAAVPAVPLDDLFGGLDRLDLVKLDVEGADLHALRGMAGLLARLRPVLFIEDHSIYGYYAHGELLDTLADLGYRAKPFTAHLAGDRQAPYVIAEPATGPGSGEGEPA